MFSQHPYAENFIGKPHVWTVDYNNSEEFEAAIKAIMKTQVRFRSSQDSGGHYWKKMPLLVNSGSQAWVGKLDPTYHLEYRDGGTERQGNTFVL